MRGNIQLFGQDRTVAGSLVEHIQKVAVLEDIFHLAGGQQILHVLRNAGRDAAPLTEPFPDLHGIGRRLFLAEQQMEFVHVVAGGLACVTVGRDTAPDLIVIGNPALLLRRLAK